MFEYSFFTMFTSLIGFFALILGGGFLVIKILEMEWNYRSGLKDDLREIRKAVDEIKTRGEKSDTQGDAR